MCGEGCRLESRLSAESSFRFIRPVHRGGVFCAALQCRVFTFVAAGQKVWLAELLGLAWHGLAWLG